MPAPFSTAIEGSNPCGADLRSSVELFSLREIAKGKPETQFSEARDPDWRDLRKTCEGLLARSKDLEVFVFYILSRLQIEGVAGLAEGFAALADSMISHWEQVYPLLDEGDPTERLNIVSGLAMPLGSFEDPLRFIERLRAKPLIRSARAGTLNLNEIEARLNRGEVEKSVTEAELKGFFGDADPAFTQLTRDSLEKTAAQIERLEHFLDETVGSSAGASWVALKDTLKGQIATYARYTSTGTETAAPPTTGGNPAATSPAGVAPAPSSATVASPVAVGSIGSIGSRDDVIRLLDSICKYYQANEPSSPVPIVLRRAQGLVKKNFSEIISELAPGTTPQISILEPPADV